MDKWKKYGTYERWKSENIDDLRSNFKADHDVIMDMIEPPSFDDYCMGTWQRL